MNAQKTAPAASTAAITLFTTNILLVYIAAIIKKIQMGSSSYVRIYVSLCQESCCDHQRYLQTQRYETGKGKRITRSRMQHCA